MSRVLVTGGAGFIGSHLTDALVARGDKVIVLDNLFSGRMENLEESASRIEFVKGDIRDYDLVREVMDGVEVVFHLAAIASVPLSVDDPLTTTLVNVVGTQNLLFAAKEAKARRFIFAASSAAYGDCHISPQREDLLPAPVSPYAASKVAGEYYCRSYSLAYGLETVSLRYFNCFGPRQNPSSHYAAVIPRFITALLSGERPVIFGSGRQSRDFVYVGDVVQANLLAADYEGVLMGDVFNVGSGSSLDILSLLDIIASEVGVKAEPEFGPRRPGDVDKTFASIEAIRKVLGYEVKVDFREGIRRTVEWYREKGAAYWGRA